MAGLTARHLVRMFLWVCSSVVVVLVTIQMRWGVRWCVFCLCLATSESLVCVWCGVQNTANFRIVLFCTCVSCVSAREFSWLEFTAALVVVRRISLCCCLKIFHLLVVLGE